MEAIFDWIFNIAVVGTLASLFEMMLPKGDLKNFGRVVLSLVVITAIVTPMIKLLGGL